MNKLKNNITVINIISNIVLQLVNILSWFIIPKIILEYFGSEVNGLISSITQFLSYITLIEGGITGVVTASFYKPLVEKDNNKIASIIKTSNRFFRKIGYIYIAYSIGLAILYPVLFNTHFSYMYIFILTLILSLNLLIQYMFSITYKTLLNADKKGYIVSLSQSLMLILTIICSYISVKIYPNIHILKLLTGIMYILQPLVYTIYINKNYKLPKKAEEDKDLIKNRWSGFAINVAAFIHYSTDVTILTIFTDFQTVSIYSVYAIVTSGLRAIVNAVSTAINPVIGHAYAKNDNKLLNEKLDFHELVVINLVFLLFTIACLLITPFVLIYTKNINDANYNQMIFGVLLVISEALYSIKLPHLNLAYSANKFKEITIPAFIEAIINIVVSLILVKFIGLSGIAIGTILGMLYRMIFHIRFTNKIIYNRKPIIFYKKIAIYIVATIIGLGICNVMVIPTQPNIKDWIIHGIIYFFIFGLLYGLTNYIFFKKEMNIIVKKNKKVKE